MTQAPFHNQESFERAIAALIDRADEAHRGEDLDRVYQHVVNSPTEVSRLASAMYVLDEDYRALVVQAIDAYRRWLNMKGRPADDDAIFEVIRAIYEKKRA